MVVHSNLTHAEMPYSSDSIPGVTVMSSLAAFLFSAPTLLSMMGLFQWGIRSGWSRRRLSARLQALHATGAAITFGIILYNEWDAFSVACAIIYPALGATLWGRFLTGRAHAADQYSKR
jgi:cation transport ATPase